MANQSVLQIHSADGDVLSIGVSSRLVYEGSPCDAFPCWNGGTCVELRRKKTQNGHKMNINSSTINNYICKCTQYFTGQHCDQQRLPNPRNCQGKIVCPPGTFCWSELFDECIQSRKEMAKKEQKEVVDNNIDCPLVCQNGGICLRLGTAPGHLECLCPSNFAGPLCQFPSTLSAPILPGLILFSLLLFLLAILLIFCHGSASFGFFLQMGRKGAKGRKDSRKWPLLKLEEDNVEELDGDDLEMRECRPSSSTFVTPNSSFQSSMPFSPKNSISIQKDETFGFGQFQNDSKIVHI